MARYFCDQTYEVAHITCCSPASVLPASPPPRYQSMMDVRASRVASSCSVSRGRTAVENQVTSFVDALPDIVWKALPDGNLDFLNQRWYDYTGLGGDVPSG